MILPRPRAYVDWAVPVDDQGEDIGVATSEDVYRFYLEWLAEYLHKTEIPVPPNQQALLEEYKAHHVSHAIIDLSDMLGYSIWATDGIENMSADSQSFDDLHQMELECWNDFSEEEKEDWTDEEFFTSKQEFLRIQQEHTESQRVPSHIRHADIPYRPVLAFFFKDISDPLERYKLLDMFYKNFNECADK